MPAAVAFARVVDEEGAEDAGADGMTGQVMGLAAAVCGILVDLPFGGRACLLCVCARIRVVLPVTYPRRGAGRVLRRDVSRS